MEQRCSILVLNYNGCALLRQCLPSVVASAAWAGAQHRVIVVDNHSTDDSIAFVSRAFPQVEVIALPSNRYLFAYNDIVKQCDDDCVVLLNNDVIVEKDWLEPLLAHLREPTTFAVTPKIWRWRDNYPAELETCGWVPRVAHGLILCDTVETDRSRFNLYAHGGCSAYARAKFLALGGFDELFSPGYYEDTDLSYRAWKMGWRCIAEPRARVYHIGAATTRRVWGSRAAAIKRKNQLLFHWKNVLDRKLLAEHLLWLPVRLLGNALVGNLAPLRGLAMALPELTRVRERRAIARAAARLSDREILAMVRADASGVVIASGLCEAIPKPLGRVRGFVAPFDSAQDTPHNDTG